jgi:hypothetical protein
MASGQLRRMLAGQQQESVTAAINAEFDALIGLVSRELDRSAQAAREAADEELAGLDRLLADAAARLGGTGSTEIGSTAPWAVQDEGTGLRHG